ncbi:hypothetical protein AMECASPLE_031881 [Ameca splendens]|uniref:Uncharacterized protein n=1 Tax=Ameca splendens TaxID=208324 RepID=A0ABV0ZSC8_9TELE
MQITWDTGVIIRRRWEAGGEGEQGAEGGRLLNLTVAEWKSNLNIKRKQERTESLPMTSLLTLRFNKQISLPADSRQKPDRRGMRAYISLLASRHNSLSWIQK